MNQEIEFSYSLPKGKLIIIWWILRLPTSNDHHDFKIVRERYHEQIICKYMGNCYDMEFLNRLYASVNPTRYNYPRSGWCIQWYPLDSRESWWVSKYGGNCLWNRIAVRKNQRQMSSSYSKVLHCRPGRLIYPTPEFTPYIVWYGGKNNLIHFIKESTAHALFLMLYMGNFLYNECLPEDLHSNTIQPKSPTCQNQPHEEDKENNIAFSAG